MEINIQNVSMTYPNGKQALKDLTLELRTPSLIGLLGPNGAGKTTLMKLLVTALLPTSGTIQVDGRSLAKSERALKSRLGYLPQDFGLFDELTVTQFLDYMASLKGLRNPKAAVRDVIKAVNLEEKKRARIRTLSGGQRQRVGIAQALLGDPTFLIFDEPTVGLDPEERIHFRNFFCEYSFFVQRLSIHFYIFNERKCSVLFIRRALSSCNCYHIISCVNQSRNEIGSDFSISANNNRFHTLLLYLL